MTSERSFAVAAAGLLVVLAAIYAVTLVHDLGSGQDVLAAAGAIAAQPWGATTFSDLGIALLLLGGWLWQLERGPWCRLGMVLGLLCLGSLAALLILAWRLRWAGSWRAWLLEPYGERS